MEAFAKAFYCFHGSFHGSGGSFHGSGGSFHGSGGSFHGSFHELPRKNQVVQETELSLNQNFKSPLRLFRLSVAPAVVILLLWIGSLCYRYARDPPDCSTYDMHRGFSNMTILVSLLVGRLVRHPYTATLVHVSFLFLSFFAHHCGRYNTLSPRCCVCSPGDCDQIAIRLRSMTLLYAIYPGSPMHLSSTLLYYHYYYCCCCCRHC